jgi:hypothetical protein
MPIYLDMCYIMVTGPVLKYGVRDLTKAKNENW